MKVCSKCNQEKPYEDFSIKRSSKDGYNGKCKECDRIDKQEYRDKHRERYRERQRRYRERNKDRINAQQRDNYSKHKEKRLSKEREKRLNSPEVELYKGAKYRAKRKNIPFDISQDDIRIPELCPVLGIPLSVGEGKLHEGSPTLDRLIPELGYIRGNINVISSLANTIKSNATWEQILAVSEWVRKTTEETCGMK